MKRIISFVAALRNPPLVLVLIFIFGLAVWAGMKAPQKPMTLRFHNAARLCVPLKKDIPVIKLTHAAPGVADFLPEYNKWFEDAWRCATGETVKIDQVVGPSGDVMRRIIGGSIRPDIVTMSNPEEMDAVAHKSSVVSSGWRMEFPFTSSPYYSAVIFAVRSGNPKRIMNWGDLINPGVVIDVSNPKACGGGRWVYTGVLGFIKSQNLSMEEYLSKFYANVPILYADQGVAAKAYLGKVGDVTVTYEKMMLTEKLQNKVDVDIVYPPRTVAIDVPVAVGVKYTQQHHTTDIARAYLQGLYTPEVQALIATHYLRPRMTVPAHLLTVFPNVSLFTRDDIFPPNSRTEAEHLGDGGIFDTLTHY